MDMLPNSNSVPGDRINIGCGRNVTEGWINLDNSPSLRLSARPWLYRLARAGGYISSGQAEYIDFCRRANITFADASRRVPASDNTIEVIYTSHMVEHLSPGDLSRFLRECRRSLVSGGTLRVAVPDLDCHIDAYNEDRDADRFLREMLVVAPPIDTLRNKISLLVTGYRHHQWMYNSHSIRSLLEREGFEQVEALAAGQTRILNPGNLDLYERESESIYVEATNP